MSITKNWAIICVSKLCWHGQRYHDMQCKVRYEKKWLLSSFVVSCTSWRQRFGVRGRTTETVFFKLLRSPGIDSLENNRIPTRFLVPIDCFKIQAQYNSSILYILVATSYENSIYLNCIKFVFVVARVYLCEGISVNPEDGFYISATKVYSRVVLPCWSHRPSCGPVQIKYMYSIFVYLHTVSLSVPSLLQNKNKQ